MQEPTPLSVVRALTRHLEVLPTILVVFLGERGVAEPILLVVNV